MEHLSFLLWFLLAAHDFFFCLPKEKFLLAQGKIKVGRGMYFFSSMREY